ncbi:MAG TPA: translocation/assembly module TamB domain-containing protein [Polyangiales bacterium]
MAVRWKLGLRRAALIVSALIVGLPLALVLALALAPRAPAVRGMLRERVAPVIGNALHARVTIAEIEALSLSYLSLKGVRILDLHGHELASAQQLSAHFRLWDLLRGRVLITSALVEQPFVDLGAPLDEGGGLPGLFKAPSASGPKPSSSSVPTVELRHVRVRRGSVEATLAGSRFRVDRLEALAGVESATELGLRVASLSARASRDGQPLGDIRLVQLQLAAESELHGRALIDLEQCQLTLGLDLQRGWTKRDARVWAQLEVQRLSPTTWSAFGFGAGPLSAPVDLRVSAWGRRSTIRYVAALETPAGRAQLEGSLRDLNTLDATLTLVQLQLQRFLRVSLPTVSARLRVHVNGKDSLRAADAWLHLDRAYYGSVPFPDVQLLAHANEARVLWVERLYASYPNGAGSLDAQAKLTAHGTLEVYGRAHVSSLAALSQAARVAPGLSGRADATVHLQGEAGGTLRVAAFGALGRLAYGKGQVAAARFGVEVEAALPALGARRISARLHTDELQFARAGVPQLDLTVVGALGHYEAHAGFGSRGGLSARADRVRGLWTASVRAAVAVRPHDWLRAGVSRLSYRARRLTLEGAHLEYCGATLHAAGTLDARSGSQLTLHVRVPDLDAATRAFTDRPITGAALATATLRGSAAKPELALDASYRAPNLAGLRDARVVLALRVDGRRRLLELQTDAYARGAAVHGAAHGGWRGDLSLAALQRGRHEITLRLDHLPLAELDLWPKSAFAPSVADVSGRLHGAGTWGEPVLDGQLESQLRWTGDDAPLRVSLAGRYTRSELDLTIDGSDSAGPLVHSRVHTKLEGSGGAKRQQGGVAGQLADRSWETSLSLAARRLDQLPAAKALNLSPGLWPAKVSANAQIRHEPHAEPVGKLEVDAVWPPPAAHSDDERCGLWTEPRIAGTVDMQDGALATKIRVVVAKREVLALDWSSKAPLDDWLRPSSVQPVNVWVRVSALRLADFPEVCEVADGQLDGTVVVSRALYQSTRVDMDLHGSALRWGKGPSYDLRVSAKAQDEKVSADARIALGAGFARITGTLPLDVAGRMPTIPLDGPIRALVRLDKIDVRALLGPLEIVHARGGELSGQLQLTGSLRAPLLDGRLRLHDVSGVIADLGQPFEHVTGEVVIDHNRLVLEPTTVRDLAGKAQVSGQLQLTSLHTWQAELSAHAANFPVRRSGAVLANVTSNATLHAKVTPARTELTLSLRRARIELSDVDLAGAQTLASNPEIVWTDARGRSQREKVAVDTGSFVLQIDASEPFWMRRKDFSARLRAHLRLEIDGDNPPSVSGQVDIERGFVELLGQLFDIERGKIEFAGGHAIEPVLELRASRRMPSGRKVSLEATGPLHHPVLAFFVDDASVTAADAMAALTGTQTGNDGGASLQSQVGSVATGIAAGLLTLGARRELGDWVPMLAIDQSRGATSVRAGADAQRLIPGFLRKLVVDAYVEGILSERQSSSGTPTSDSQAASQTGAAVLIELRFPRSLVGQAQYGPGQRWSTDLTWEP